MSHPLVLPMLIQMALALLILFVMAPRRVSAIKKAGGPSALKKAGGFTASLNNMGDNFKNQFELPVIFYGLCLLFITIGEATPSIVSAAWVFVVLRVVHSIVQCTKNQIFPTRFGVFLVSSLALVYMLVMAILQAST